MPEEKNIFENVSLYSERADQDLIKFFNLNNPEEKASIKSGLESAISRIANPATKEKTEKESGVADKILSMLQDEKSLEMIEVLSTKKTPFSVFDKPDPQSITIAAVMAGANQKAWKTIAENLSPDFRDKFFGMTDDEGRTPLMLIAKQSPLNGIGSYNIADEYNHELLNEALDFISPSKRKGLLTQADKSQNTAAMSTVAYGAVEGMKSMTSRLEKEDIAPVLLAQTSSGISAYEHATRWEETTKEAHSSIAESVRKTIKEKGKEGLQYLTDNTPKEAWAHPLLLERGEAGQKNGYETIIDQEDLEMKALADRAIGKSLATIAKKIKEPNDFNSKKLDELIKRVRNVSDISQVMQTAYNEGLNRNPDRAAGRGN